MSHYAVPHELTAAACPPGIVDALTRYLAHGIETGGFLRAVLANDLTGAFARADPDSARAMASIVAWVFENAAASTHGSYEIVDAHIARKLEQRRQERAQ